MCVKTGELLLVVKILIKKHKVVVATLICSDELAIILISYLKLLLPQKIYFKTATSGMYFKIALSKNAFQNYYLRGVLQSFSLKTAISVE